MPYLDGTRTSTLAMDHTQDVTVTIINPIGIVAPPTWDNQLLFKRTNFTFSGHLGFSGQLTVVASAYAINSTTWGWDLKATVVVDNGHGTTQTTTVTIASGTSTAYYVDASATYAGSFSASVGTDKLWDIAETAFSTTAAPTRFPAETSYTWYERSTVGSTATCSLSVGGSTVTATSTVSSTRQTADYTASLSATGAVTGPMTHNFGVSQIKVNGTTVPDLSHNQTKGIQTATEWSLSLEADDVSGIYRSASGTISTSVCLARSVSMFGRIRAWDGAYPDSVSVPITGFDGGSRTVTATSGSWSGSDTFNNYSATTTLTDMSAGTGTLTTSLNDVPAWISAALSGSSLTTNGDDNTNGTTRVLFRGWRFNGWSVAESATRTISGTGNNRLFSPYEGMSGYRYLDVQVRANSGTNEPGVIELTDYHGNTKSWNVIGATTSYATVTLDLCSPDSHSLAAIPDKDSKDNPYPRKNTTSTSYAGSESVDSAFWGVTSCRRIHKSSGQIHIGTTTLKYTNTDSTYVPDTVSSAFERKTASIVAEVGTTTYFYGRRFWQHDRDGRNEEESDVHWQMTVGGGTGVTTYAVSMLTVAQLAAEVNASDDGIVRHPGWVMTRSVAQPGGGTCAASQPPLRDCYLNGDTGLATWLYGGGALLTPNATTGTDFTYGHKVTGNITAQTLFDKINGNFPPDLYDPFDINGGSDSALYLGGVSLLRGIAHGGLLDTAGDIVTTGTVDLIRTSDNSNRGTDSTIDAEGRYYTGAPYGLGEANHHVDYVTKSINLNPIHTSHRHRAWFRDVLQELFSAIEAYKTKGFLMLGKATKINVRLQDAPLTERLAGTVITSDNIVKLRDSDNTGDFIFMLIKGSTSYTLSYTTDNGATKGDLLTVTAGTAGFECDTNRGLLIIIYDDGTTATPGNIKYRKSRDLGATWTTAANCTINSVTPQVGKVLDTSYDPHLGGMLYAIFDISGSKKVCRSTDLGATWEVVLT